MFRFLEELVAAEIILTLAEYLFHIDIPIYILTAILYLIVVRRVLVWSLNTASRISAIVVAFLVFCPIGFVASNLAIRFGIPDWVQFSIMILLITLVLIKDE